MLCNGVTRPLSSQRDIPSICDLEYQVLIVIINVIGNLSHPLMTDLMYHPSILNGLKITMRISLNLVLGS